MPLKIAKDCAVPGCGRRQSLHILPSEPNIRNAWLKFVYNEVPASVGKSFSVCSLHFTAESFANKSQVDAGFAVRLRLTNNAVPTILDPSETGHQYNVPTKQDVACQTDTPPCASRFTQLSLGTLRPKFRSKGTQTEASVKSVRVSTTTSGETFQPFVLPHFTSTPSKDLRPTKRARLELEGEESDSFKVPDQQDTTYEPAESVTTVTESSQLQCTSTQEDEKYIVFENCLLQLFNTCPVCSRRCDVRPRRKGTFIAIDQLCQHCQYFRQWKSQPVVGSTPLGNLQLSAAVYFNGGSFLQLQKIFNTMRVRSITHRTFLKHASMYLEPAKINTCKKEQEVLQQLSQGDKVIVGGDMRADSPDDSFLNRGEYNAGFAQRLILKNSSVPTLTGQPADNGPKPDVDCCESSVYVNVGSSSESLNSVRTNQDQTLPDKHLSEETSGPTQESELNLTLLCYSESSPTDAHITVTVCDSDQDDESSDQISTDSRDFVCNAGEQQEILQTTVETCSFGVGDCRNQVEIKTETIEEEHDSDDEEEDDDDDYDEDDGDDFVPSDEHCDDDDDDDFIPSDEIDESSDEEKEKKIYECPYCEKRFSSTTDVKYHVRLHTNEKPYQCSVCGKTFRLSGSLKSHEKTHSEEKPFPCSHCDKRFRNKHRVMVHERVHTGEKPYLCQDCGKSFSNTNAFNLHLRIHTGEKPYQCSQCEKTFARHKSYKIHQRVHTGVKPFPCSFCGKSFTRRDNLTTHQRIHTGEKPYKCTQCDMGFTQAVLLRLHQKKHTEGEP